MSYKYIYGYTNSLSYELSKVVYFGKQDRMTDELTRIYEHRQEKDPNYKALSKVRYVIFAKVPSGVSLSDIEAYLIQTNNPKLNKIYSSENQKKLSAADILSVKNSVDSLEWHMMKNDSQSYMRVSNIIANNEKHNKMIKEASYTFPSRECVSLISFERLKKLRSKGRIFILPKIKNAHFLPLLEVLLTYSHISRSGILHIRE